MNTAVLAVLVFVAILAAVSLLTLLGACATDPDVARRTSDRLFRRPCPRNEQYRRRLWGIQDAMRGIPAGPLRDLAGQVHNDAARVIAAADNSPTCQVLLGDLRRMESQLSQLDRRARAVHVDPTLAALLDQTLQALSDLAGNGQSRVRRR